MSDKKHLHIAPHLSLPLRLVVMKQSIFGMSGSGKSYNAAVEVEEMLDAKQQVLILDPTDAWYGLRSSADGKKPGYDIPVFGGFHADAPLSHTAGAMMAQMVVKERFSGIFSLIKMSLPEMRRFCADFLNELGRTNNKYPCHVVLDEIDIFAPQAKKQSSEISTEAVNGLVRRNRNNGIGCTMISQHPQLVDIDIRSQAEVMFCMRLGGKRAINAVKEWFERHGTDEQMREIDNSIAKLKNGEGWICSPTLDIFQRIQGRERRTYNSSQTPEPGKQSKPPKTMAQIDIHKLGEQIAKTVEEQKSNDPIELRKQVASLRSQLTQAQARPVGRETVLTADPKLAQALFGAQTENTTLREAIAKVQSMFVTATMTAERQLQLAVGENNAAMKEANRIVRDALKGKPFAAPIIAANLSDKDKETLRTMQHKPTMMIAEPRPALRDRDSNQIPADLEGLTRPQTAILKALSLGLGIGRDSLPRTFAAFLSGASSTSSSFANNVSTLNVAGLIKKMPNSHIGLTNEGVEKVGRVEEVLTSAELLDRICVMLTGPQQRILRLLFEIGEEGLSRTEVAERTGASPTSSSFANNISTLNVLQVIEKQPDSRIRAAGSLYLEGGY